MLISYYCANLNFFSKPVRITSKGTLKGGYFYSKSPFINENPPASFLFDLHLPVFRRKTFTGENKIKVKICLRNVLQLVEMKY